MTTEEKKNQEQLFRYDALLILGPTGSGKTPLGDHLHQAGIDERRCLHFDFGVHLRRVLTDDHTGLTSEEVAVVRRAVDTGALLEDPHFIIVEKLLLEFIDQVRLDPEDLLILNGLPRHAGQAEDLSSIVDIRWVVVLECTPQTVLQRIQQNIGGDRGERPDDTLASIEQRVRRFQERTRPLIDTYTHLGSLIVRIPVKIDTDPETIRQGWLKEFPPLS